MQRETAAYRSEQRGNAAVDGLKPIYQGDYVLVQLPGQALTLQQVCNGVFLQDASEAEMCFTTVEHAHEPQDGVQGLWETFVKKVNPLYDPD